MAYYNYTKSYYRRRSRRYFYNVTLILIIINIVFFLTAVILQYFYGDVISYNIAITPHYILNGQKLWTIITSMFMHGSTLHLFVNMLSLLFIGSFLERLIGSRRFIFIYLISGIIASLTFVFLAFLFKIDLNSPAVGASGAIFGIGGVLAVLTPKVPVYILFIPIAMPLWIGITLMLILMWLASIALGLPIGNTAHLGGFITGLIYGFYLRLRYRKRIMQLDRYFNRF